MAELDAETKALREEEKEEFDREAINALRNHFHNNKISADNAISWVQARQLEKSLEIANSLSLLLKRLDLLSNHFGVSLPPKDGVESGNVGVTSEEPG